MCCGIAAAGLCFVDAPPAEAIVCQSPCVTLNSNANPRISLALYWNGTNLDNATVASGDSRNELTAAGYSFVRNEAQVFRDYQSGLVPLVLHRKQGYTDYDTAASDAALSEACGLGFQFIRLEGWVYATQQTGTVPIELFFVGTDSNQQVRNDYFLVATQASRDAMTGLGYVSKGIQGWVYPP